MRYTYGYILMLLALTTQAFPQTIDLNVEQGPILQGRQAKHNVLALFDDSASIQNDTVYVSEHFYGYGYPKCQKPSNWASVKNSPQYKNGNYYDPFMTGSYVPYDPMNSHTNYDGSIYIEQCSKINRGIAFKGLYKAVFIIF